MIIRHTMFALAAFFTLFFVQSVNAEELRNLSVEARSIGDLGGLQGAREEFDFGDTKAWLREDGYWQIEGVISHTSGFCGTYELGIQFGSGSPGCSNAEWLSAPMFVSQHRQCNGSSKLHSGGNFSLLAQERFKTINCAQRVIRCSGKCS
jgi:hypothetical protein